MSRCWKALFKFSTGSHYRKSPIKCHGAYFMFLVEGAAHIQRAVLD